MSDKLDATNMWLAILALVSVAEFLMIVTVAFVCFRLCRRATEAMNRIEAEYIAPITAKVNVVFTNVNDLTERVQRADDKVHAVIARMEDTAGRVATFARRAWPVVGTWRAVGAAVGALRRDHHPATDSRRLTARRATPLGPADWRTH